MSDYFTNVWQVRIDNANKMFDQWHSEYKCDILYDYYKCKQWKMKKDQSITNYVPYTINMFYSTIKIKMASLLFQRPSFLVSPRPGVASWDMESAVRSAELKQDALNTIIQNPNINFAHNVKLAALESWFRFGMLEVGYAADWRNPLKQEPLLNNRNDNSIQDSKIRVVSDEEVPINERLYVKRIPAQRFRIAVCEATQLDEAEWVGYYEYYYTDMLKKAKGIKWPKDSGLDSNTFSGDTSGIIGGVKSVLDTEIRGLIHSGAISKVWHIFDTISKKRCLYLDGHMDEPMWDADQERLPFIDLRWDLELDTWYPIPPTFQWLSSQDEINEAREQTRSFRRRFTRKFQVKRGGIKDDEVEKFASGPDGILITVEEEDSIKPIQNPEQGQTAEQALIIAKDDFNIISGTSAEARGQSSDRETATQAKIIAARSQIRESAEQMDFSTFLCCTGREILAQAGEKLSGDLWIKYSIHPSENLILQDMQLNAPYFKAIKAQDLSDGYDFDIDLDVINQTPAAMEQQKDAFISFLTVVQNFPAISLSPILIREAAYRMGYRNERVIQQMQQAAILAMAAKASQAMGGQPLSPALAGGGGGQSPATPDQTQNAQMATPSMEQTQTQLNNQLQ